MSDEVRKIPIRIVLAEDCGERGAHYLAVSLLRDGG
jgi:hypothetical protein